jgi:hypothetical protein|nr:MAG TPA: hypothetical protein [Caudoviricetes sp.]
MGENIFEFKGLTIESDESIPIPKNSKIIVFGSINDDKTIITLDISKDKNLLESINKIMNTPYLIGKGPNNTCIVKRAVEDFEYLNSRDVIMIPSSFSVEFTEERALRATIYFKFGWDPNNEYVAKRGFGPAYMESIWPKIYNYRPSLFSNIPELHPDRVKYV